VSASVGLRLRVIVVTTRAALRHADDDPAQRMAIIARGQALIGEVTTTTSEEDADVAQALAELDGMSGG
jgi:hypothetical protein